ncbi:MFS transporter [Glutamicibacter ardleyensis]|uniref:MFS transporter n=1 Tax=Glutamicibacter ardleyensis TaxID=225894 RepID=UPI003FCF4A8F
MQQHMAKPGAGLLLVLLASVGIAPLFTYGLSATSDLVISELQISETQFGLLATVCFGCAAIGNAAFSKFADRRTDASLFIIVFGLSAAALALAAIPSGYALLLVAAMFAGFAQSFPNGVTNRVLVQRVPGAQRITWTGIKQSGVQVSQLVGSLGFPLLAAWIGWRGASLVGAILAAVLGVLTVRLINATAMLPLAQSKTPKSVEVSTGPSTRFIVITLTAFGFINGMGVQATNVYLPLFAVRELHFSLFLGGLTAAVAGAFGVAARIGWGALMSKGISAPKLLLTLALLATSGALTFRQAQVQHSAPLLWLAVLLHGAAALGVSVVLMAALLRAVPAASLGSSTGIVSAGQFAGFTFGPLAMGALISSPGGFTTGWLAVTGVYLCCVGLGLYLVLRKRS